MKLYKTNDDNKEKTEVVTEQQQKSSVCAEIGKDIRSD
jgi:hypothetical protein